ncbi:zinc finger Y-chromosomal protein 2-like [Anoplophora glabripennis]|uniref:zinc finger Y-chromosomal protein 2-like n=1 Tax=Anoplophora glabripennis TaxID=217634 RepID=UPI0008749897|nr:zinc finger Y-chromosomal protein 2-like [Anoplophora glabripennis]
MASIKQTICRLCLATIPDKNFKVVDEYTKAVLDIPLLKLKYEDGDKHVVCNLCYERLNAASEFKSTCLDTYNTIIPYVDCEKMSGLDLREIYMKENGKVISCDQKVCQLCMHLVTSEFRRVLEAELDVILKFVPELNTCIAKDPVICTLCFNSLYTHNVFLKDCSIISDKVGGVWDSQIADGGADLFIKTENLRELELEVDGKIRGICDSSVGESQTEINVLPSGLFIKTENLDKDYDINEMEMSVKTECVEIKSEEDEGRNYTLQPSFTDVIIKNSYNGDVEEKELQNQNPSVYKNNKSRFTAAQTKTKNSLSSRMRHKNIKGARKYKIKATHPLGRQTMKCNDCSYETIYRKNFVRHILRHKNVVQAPKYTCDMCNFKSMYKESLIRHQVSHKSTSETHMYKCDVCDYESRYKKNLDSHQMTHKSRSEGPMYRCSVCDYESRYRKNIRYHELRHKDASQVQMFRCNDCDYITRYKNNIASHVMKHRKLPHECNDCDYKTTNKSHLQRHELKHKSVAETEMYSCELCDYVTKYKGNLTGHLLRHEIGAKALKYSCDICDFETKSKANINIHELTHKNRSKAQLYTCDTCDYATYHKSRITSHELKHRDPTQVQMYKCNDCHFETKYKKNILSHVMTHKEALEERMHQCDKCEYTAKTKRNLQRHLLRHKTASSELIKYDCDLCDFQTTSKQYLKFHQFNHETSTHLYQCSKCDYKTKQSYLLVAHEVRHKVVPEAQT